MLLVAPCQTWRREPELPGLTAEHRKFIGFWRYTSTERRADDGEVLPAASWENGFVIYTASGHMAVHLVRPDRQPYAASPPTDAEVLAALGSYASYFGTYTIDEGAGIITHHVEGNLSPNGTGADNRRAYEFDDDTLVLMPPRGRCRRTGRPRGWTVRDTTRLWAGYLRDRDRRERPPLRVQPRPADDLGVRP